MKRPIVALEMPGVTPGYVETDLPYLRWVDPSTLLVDEAYQRNLSDRSIKLIRKIVTKFDWRRFKPPIAVDTEGGTEVLDGQHTSIAAAIHPRIDQIPIIIVSAPELQDRAGAFIGHNKDRLTVSTTQMHHAAVAAMDDDALTIDQVCERAGVRVLRVQPGQGSYKPRDTMAVTAIGGLISKFGALRARQMLQVLSDAGCAPIGVVEIRAVSFLMTNDDYKNAFKPEDLTVTIRTLGPQALEDAKLFCLAHKVPAWRGLAVTWFKAVRKVRGNGI